MEIDRFTITALLVFIIMLAVFVRFCMVKVCGMAAMHWHGRQGRDEKPAAKDGA
jgi:hypothetical protein